MAKLTLADLMAGPQPPAPTGGKKLTLDDLMTGPQPKSPGIFATISAHKKGTDQAIKTGLTKNLSGLTNLLADVGFASGLNAKAQQLANQNTIKLAEMDPEGKTSLTEKASEFGLAAVEAGAAAYAAKGALAPIAERAIPKGVSEWAAKQAGRNPLTRFATRALKSMPEGAAFGAITSNQNESPVTGMMLGAALTPIGVAGADAIGKIAQLLTKTHAIKALGEHSDVPLKSLKKTAEDTAGGHVMLGKALNNDEAYKEELNLLPKAAGFKKDANQKLNDVQNRIIQQGNIIFEALSPNTSQEGIAKGLKKAVDRNAKKVQAKKKALYKVSNVVADKANVRIQFNNFGKTAKRLKKEFGQVYLATGIEANKEGMKSLKSILEKVYKSDSGEIKLILPDYLQKELDSAKKTASTSSLRTANFAKSALSDKKYTAMHAGDTALESIYSQLARALSKDIEAGLKGAPAEVTDAYNIAQAYYKKYVVPLQEKGISNILFGKRDPDTIADAFLPKSGKKRLNLLTKFLHNAPGSADLLLSNALSNAPALTNINAQYVRPSALYKALQDIGPDRLKILLNNSPRLAETDLDTDDILSAVKSFQNNMENGREVFDRMINPQTGQVNQNWLSIKTLWDYIGNVASSIGSLNASEIVGTAALPLSVMGRFHALNDSGETLKKIIELKEKGKTKEGPIYTLAKAIRKSGKTAGLAETKATNSGD